MANTHSVDLELSSSQYLSITDGDQTGLDITGDISIEAWIKLEQLPSTAGAQFGVAGKYDDLDSSEQGYSLRIADGDDKLLMLFKDSSANLTRFSLDTAFDSDDVGEWLHIAVAVDVSAPSAVIYVNGQVSAHTATHTAATSIDDVTAPFLIGNVTGSSKYFDGKINELRVFNDIRTAQEILDNYKRQFDGAVAGCQGCWNFNNNLTDVSGNGNDLTNNNSATFSTDVPDWGRLRSIGGGVASAGTPHY